MELITARSDAINGGRVYKQTLDSSEEVDVYVVIWRAINTSKGISSCVRRFLFFTTIEIYHMKSKSFYHVISHFSTTPEFHWH